MEAVTIAGTIFDYSAIFQKMVTDAKVAAAAKNAKSVEDYKAKCAAWITENTQTRDRLRNVGFVPTAMPAIPHKVKVDESNAQEIDLGPFPDLLPPVLPPYVESTSTAIAAANPAPDPQVIAIVLLQKALADIAAIKAKVGA